MKILITGGNGFLGVNLIHFFLKKNYELLVVSRNKNNLIPFLDSIQYLDNFDSKKIIDFSPNIIIHLAWDGGNSYSDINNISQINTNILFSVELLKIINCLKEKPHFIGFGSFTEYGIFNSVVNENSKESPISFYGLSKNCLKKISELFCAQNDILWTWARVCYVYGPQDSESRLIPRIIKKLISNEEIVLNSCDTIIDYLFIDDFCSAIDSIISKKVCGVYNICSGKKYQMKEIIKFLHNKINPKSKILFDSNLDRKFSSKFMCGSNKKIKRDTKWKDTTSLEQGLLKTIQYYYEG